MQEYSERPTKTSQHRHPPTFALRRDKGAQNRRRKLLDRAHFDLCKVFFEVTKKLPVTVDRGWSQTPLISEMSSKSWSLIAKGKRPPPSSQSKVREKQTQHLLNRTTHRVGHAFPRPIGPAVPSMLLSPANGEVRDVIVQIRPRASFL